MIRTGLDIISAKIPDKLRGKKLAILCHAPSINSAFMHIIELITNHPKLEAGAIFGPQHGLFGETQDNMIEWEGYMHPKYKIPIYSLYGKHRKPAPSMLKDIDAMIIDLQDIGARPYTYIWTMKHCMEACSELDIPVWVLDRPNPVSNLNYRGPLLKRDYFTFVGGAEIPLCHNMTIGEIALWLNHYEDINCRLEIVWMENWERGMSFSDTRLPWVPPSPNMPSLNTAMVYPGTVLTEALNLSEARGTTTPFELFGAPDLSTGKILRNLEKRKIEGCVFRSHDYIPTFHKYQGDYCKGIFIHVTDSEEFDPVYTAINIYSAIIETNPGYLAFKEPPYEYEYKLMPFDILIGDNITRDILLGGSRIHTEKERWQDDIQTFLGKFSQISYY